MPVLSNYELCTMNYALTNSCSPLLMLFDKRDKKARAPQLSYNKQFFPAINILLSRDLSKTH